MCFLPQRRFVHEELGFNYRFTNLQAALGLAQLERLDEFITKKREMGRYYDSQFAGRDEFILPPVQTIYAENIYWVFGMILSEKVPFDAEEMMARLSRLGVGSRPFFWGMHEQPVFNKMGWYLDQSYPVASNIGRRGFYIPSGLGITRQQQEQVVSAVQEALTL